MDYPKENHLVSFWEKKATLLLGILITLSSIAWTAITFWKYNHFLYNALDLGIYEQVFWNTSYGRWFEMSIHPQSYLGDHFEPLILLLTPLYSLWRDPRMLILIQILTLQLAAVPLYLLARNILYKSSSIIYPKALAFVVALAYLLNPFLHNAIVFEFHILPFLVLPIFLALYFAERGKLWSMLLCLVTALLIREDVSFIVALFGLV